ncbi:unnamed protein product [Arabidopsis halleri]
MPVYPLSHSNFGKLAIKRKNQTLLCRSESPPSKS